MSNYPDESWIEGDPLDPDERQEGTSIMRLIVVLLIVVGLIFFAAACSPIPPTVSAISDSSVTVSHHPMLDGKIVWQKAADSCAVYGKQPVTVGYRCTWQVYGTCTQAETIFACR